MYIMATLLDYATAMHSRMDEATGEHWDGPTSVVFRLYMLALKLMLDVAS